MPPGAFAEIVTATTANGTNFDCPLLEQVERAVRARDEYAANELSAAIQAQC